MPLSLENRERLGGISVSTLTTSLFKRGLRNQFMHGVHPIAPEMSRLVGEAFTVRCIPAREDIDTLAFFGKSDSVQRRAFEECPPGHVLVMDARGDERAACAGDLLIARLKARGCAGIVTDGGFRDRVGITKLDFPAYQRSTISPPSLIAHHPVDLNVPIGCGNVPVYPGDVIVGDGDGVVVLPAHLAEEIVNEALETTEYEDFVDEQVTCGRSLFGLFPPDDETQKFYAQWKSERRGRSSRS